MLEEKKDCEQLPLVHKTAIYGPHVTKFQSAQNTNSLLLQEHQGNSVRRQPHWKPAPQLDISAPVAWLIRRALTADNVGIGAGRCPNSHELKACEQLQTSQR